MINKIKRYLIENKKDIEELQYSLSQLTIKVNESIATTQLTSLLSSGPYLPFSKASLNFTSLAIFLNDILINNRKTVFEFGSGISTIVAARLLRRNGLDDRKIISIDHDMNWISVVRNLLMSENLLKYVELGYCPLSECELAINNTKWYDTNTLTNILQTMHNKIDSILVDGPPAWYEEVAVARYPALPFLIKLMNDSSIIFLDDTNRTGEQLIISKWQQFGLKEINFSASFTAFCQGSYFDVTLR